MTLLEDLSTAARALRKRPWHSGLTVAVLTIAIGGNAAIFSVANGLFLKPLPVDEPSRIVAISEAAPEWNREQNRAHWDAINSARKNSIGYGRLPIALFMKSLMTAW